MTISDTLAWLSGRHSFKAGGLYSHQSILDGFSLGVTGAAGNYTFTGAATGNSFADLLLGLPSRTDEGINTRGTNPLDAYSNEFAVFAQDDWKVTTALTLFLGARYALDGNFIERNNLLINFDPKTAALVLPSQDLVNFLSPEAERLPRRLAGDLGLGRALVRNDANNISPRVGLAYRVGSDNRTVLRADLGTSFRKLLVNRDINTAPRQPKSAALVARSF